MSSARAVRFVGGVTATILLTSCIGFAAPETVSVAGSAVLADVTGDGSADILSSSTAGLTRYDYCGAGCLHQKEVIPGVSVRLLGDFNNDDVDDVLAFDGSNYEVLFGSATGLSAAGAVTLPPITNSAFVSVGDFNGDGNDDLVRNGSVAGVDVFTFTAYLGDGNGHFAASSLVAAATGGEIGRTQVEIADVDGNGRDDIVTTFVNRIDVARLGDPTCNDIITFTCPYIDATISSDLFAFGDINGDGKADFARYQFSTHSVDFFRSTGTGFTPFPAYQTINVAVSGQGVQMSLRDIDNDGITDFLLNDGATAATWWSGTNDGGFPYQTLSDVPLRATGCAPCLGDVNGDGRLDAIVPNTTSTNELWLNTSVNP